MKTRTDSVVALVVSSVVFHLVNGDEKDVWCHWNTCCILAASFPVGTDVLIQWFLEDPWGNQLQVHSFYNNTDQLEDQNEQFRGRTSLFKENITAGNASLLIKNVVVEDAGRYKCYVGTSSESQESFINLHVEAPIQDIRMELKDEGMFFWTRTCYPTLSLVWSRDPPTDVGLIYKTKLEQRQSGFYQVESWMELKTTDCTNIDFICEVSNEGNSKKGRLRKEEDIHVSSGSELKVPCSFPDEEDTYELVWKIDHSEHILSMIVKGLQRRMAMSEKWKIYITDEVTSWRHLKLLKVVPEHHGTYTCEVRTNRVTYVTQTHVIVPPDWDLPRLYYIVAIMAFVLFVGVMVIIIMLRKRRKSQNARRHRTQEEDIFGEMDSNGVIEEEATHLTSDVERQNLSFQ